VKDRGASVWQRGKRPRLMAAKAFTLSEWQRKRLLVREHI